MEIQSRRRSKQLLPVDALSQSVLFRFQDRLWVKTDHTAVPVNTACTADAFALLFQYFHVLNVSYPAELWIVFGFFEKMLGLKPTVGKSVVLVEFCQHVLQ